VEQTVKLTARSAINPSQYSFAKVSDAQLQNTKLTVR
jgi:hypothetical protein